MLLKTSLSLSNAIILFFLISSIFKQAQSAVVADEVAKQNLDSVILQTFNNWELIIIDNNSYNVELKGSSEGPLLSSKKK